MNRILIAGSLAYDRIMDFPGKFADHILPDAIHALSVGFSVNPPKEQFGGTAGNIAYSLAQLGGSPHILATAGNDFATFEEHLKAEGIATTAIEVSPDLPTASAYIITDSGNNQITAFSPAADALPYKGVLDQEAELAIIAPTGVVKMQDFPQRFKDTQIPYLFDPGQQIVALSDTDLKAGIEGSRGLIVNDYELALVKGQTLWSEDEILMHTQMLIVTYGAEGSKIRTKEATTHVDAVAVANVVDPTGAGDAYRAGLMHGLVAGLSEEESAKIGSVVASFAVECYGTQNHRFTLDQVKERYTSTYQSPFPF